MEAKKHPVNSKCRPSAICLQRDELRIDEKSVGNYVERSILDGRYFYHFATFAKTWNLFIFNSIFRQSFVVYNVSDLHEHFDEMDFHFVAYDHDFGIIYNINRIAKVQLDHQAKKLRLISEVHTIPRETDYPFKFDIHTVEILAKDIVFIYTCRMNNIISQRLYLYDWNNFPKRLNMCKIGIRDASNELMFVSGQVLDGRRLCMVHMQDKSREFGKIAPLVLFWNSEGQVACEKFEKIECDDGKPFFTKLKCKTLDNKEFSGTWTRHYFSLLITRYMPKSCKWNSYIFVFDAIVKSWYPLIMPKHIKLIKSPLISFTNDGDDDSPILVFYAKGTTVPKQTIRMPIRHPEKLQDLAEICAAQHGHFNRYEKTAIVQMRLNREVEQREEHKILAREHEKKSREHFLKAVELKKQLNELQLLNRSSFIPFHLNPSLADFEVNDNEEISK